MLSKRMSQHRQLHNQIEYGGSQSPRNTNEAATTIMGRDLKRPTRVQYSSVQFQW